MLQRLRVRGFKSLRDVDIRLPQLGILFGANASGKSNLLEALQALAWMGNMRTLFDALGGPAPVRGQAFEAFSLDPSGYEAMLANGQGRFLLEADIQAEGELYRYRIEPRIDYRSGALTVRDEYLARLRSKGTPWGNPAIERVNDVLYIRRKGKGSRPRVEEVGQNHSLLSDGSFSGSGYEGLDAVRRELAAWRCYALEPRIAMRSEWAPQLFPTSAARASTLLRSCIGSRPNIHRATRTSHVC